MVLLTGVGHTPCWDCRVYLYRFFDLCCLTHIPLVDASNAPFWLSNDSCGDGRGGVELLLLDPSSLDDCGKPRLGVDCIGGIRMRNEDDDDFGVTVVEDGRDADLATVSACVRFKLLVAALVPALVREYRVLVFPPGGAWHLFGGPVGTTPIALRTGLGGS